MEKERILRVYEPLPKQREFLENPAKWRAFIGGVGCGKTTAGCMEAIRCAVQYVGGRGLIARKTWRELIHTTLDVFWSLVPLELVVRHDTEDGVIVLKAVNAKGEVGESVIFYRSLDRREKIEGLNLGWFYIDEAAEIDEEMFSALQGRVRLPVGPRRGWITTTPPSVSHWIYRKFVQEKNPAYAAIFASTYDNPHLPSDYIEYLEQSLSGEYFRRFVLGEFGFQREGAPIFANFTPSVHIVEEPELEEILDNATVLYRGIDFGFYRPAAVWGVLDMWNRLVIVDEFLGENMTLDVFLEKLKVIDAQNWLPKNKRVVIDYHDPHATYLTDTAYVDRHAVMQQKGFNPMPVPGAAARVEMGIHYIMKLMDTLIMGKAALRISHKCKMLIEGMRGGYCWDSKGKAPVKNDYAHIMDALRYLVLGLERRVDIGRSWGYRDAGLHPVFKGFSYQENFKISGTGR